MELHRFPHVAAVSPTVRNQILSKSLREFKRVRPADQPARNTCSRRPYHQAVYLLASNLPTDIILSVPRPDAQDRDALSATNASRRVDQNPAEHQSKRTGQGQKREKFLLRDPAYLPDRATL